MVRLGIVVLALAVTSCANATAAPDHRTCAAAFYLESKAAARHGNARMERIMLARTASEAQRSAEAGEAEPTKAEIETTIRSLMSDESLARADLIECMRTQDKDPSFLAVRDKLASMGDAEK